MLNCCTGTGDSDMPMKKRSQVWWIIASFAVEYYHPWGWWARLDCEKEIDTALHGPLLILRHGNHPTEVGLHRERTIGMRELSYKLFHAESKNFYLVLPEGICMPDTDNALPKFSWEVPHPVSREDIKQAEYDSHVIAMASFRLFGRRMKDITDRVSWELGGVHFKGWQRSILPVAMEARLFYARFRKMMMTKTKWTYTKYTGRFTSSFTTVKEVCDMSMLGLNIILLSLKTLNLTLARVNSER